MTTYILRSKDGALVGAVTTDRDPADFNWPDGETVETFTDEAAYLARLGELAPPPAVNPQEQQIADLIDSVSTLTAEVAMLKMGGL